MKKFDIKENKLLNFNNKLMGILNEDSYQSPYGEETVDEGVEHLQILIKSIGNIVKTYYKVIEQYKPTIQQYYKEWVEFEKQIDSDDEYFEKEEEFNSLEQRYLDEIDDMKSSFKQITEGENIKISKQMYYLENNKEDNLLFKLLIEVIKTNGIDIEGLMDDYIYNMDK